MNLCKTHKNTRKYFARIRYFKYIIYTLHVAHKLVALVQHQKAINSISITIKHKLISHYDIGVNAIQYNM